MEVIWGKREGIYFCEGGLDRWNRVDPAGEFFLWEHTGRCLVASLKSKSPPQKGRPRIAPGPLLSKVHPPLERNVNTCCRLSEQPCYRCRNLRYLDPPDSLRRLCWSRCACSTLWSCLFMLRFLAGGRAGTDGTVIGRAGRGLTLSRRNQRRAEQRRNDKRRDCKFGSHQGCLRWLQDQSKLRQAIPFRCAANISQISFSKELSGNRCAKPPSLSKHFVTLRT